MILIDASIRWSNVYLLFTYNIAFVRLLIQVIRLHAQFLNYPIMIIQLDNGGDFTFEALDDYYTSIWLYVEHLDHMYIPKMGY